MNEPIARSPRIEHISWGNMRVAGLGAAKDFKLYPGGGREWDWSETETQHVPGIQPSDVQELLDRGATVVVLSRGMDLVLQTCPEMLELLIRLGIAVHVEESTARPRSTTSWRRRPVGGLFHSTC